GCMLMVRPEAAICTIVAVPSPPSLARFSARSWLPWTSCTAWFAWARPSFIILKLPPRSFFISLPVLLRSLMSLNMPMSCTPLLAGRLPAQLTGRREPIALGRTPGIDSTGVLWGINHDCGRPRGCCSRRGCAGGGGGRDRRRGRVRDRRPADLPRRAASAPEAAGRHGPRQGDDPGSDGHARLGRRLPDDRADARGPAQGWG